MRLLLSAVFCLFIGGNSIFCQFGFRAGLEAGYFNIRNPILSDEENILMRAEGELSYANIGETGSFNALAFIRPEWYGTETMLRSVKMAVQGSYFQEGESSGWGITASAKRDLYKNFQPVIYHDLLSLQADFTSSLSSEISLRLSPGYYRQMVRYENEQAVDILSLDISAGHSFLPGLNAEGGIYTEGFSISEKPWNPLLQKENPSKGLKAGPELNLGYSAQCIITAQYRFLFLGSKNTRFPSNEQMIRFMAGTMASEKVSIMLLADYYWHKIKVRKGGADSWVSNLAYTSLNYENRILLKIGYDVTENAEVFCRTGYSKENILNGNFSEKSWSLMFGLSFSK